MNILAEIFDHLPVACYHIDFSCKVTHINAHALQLIGKLREECIGKVIEKIAESLATPEYLATIQTALIEEKAASLDFYSTIGPQWLRLTATPAGTGLIVSLSHIEDLNKFTEEALRTSEERLHKNYALLQTLYDTTLIGMSVFAPVWDSAGTIVDFRIIMVNKKIERSTGRSDMIGKLYGELFPGIKQMGLFDAMVKTIITGEPSKMEYHYTYEGMDCWYSTMFVKGEDILVSTNLDITERVKAENERFRNYLLLQQSEELAQTGSWDFDRASGIFIWSDGMYKLFELPRGITVQPEIYLAYATADSQSAAQHVVAHLLSGEHDFEETISLFIGGRTKVIHLKATIVRNDDGRPPLILGVDMDVTAMIDAESKLRILEARQQQEILQVTLNTQEEERRRLSESLHNGLGQLLYGIKLSLNFLTIKLANEDPKKYTDSKGYTDSLLVDAIKETRRISHQLMPAVLAEFGLKAAIQEVCHQLQIGVSFSCTITLGILKLDNYLELAVFRTVQELMVNVVKHAEASRAMVSVTGRNNYLKIRVEDNGKGMPPSTQDKPGIGLSSIRNKVQLLKGKLTINSSPGEGTLVEVRFPISPFNTL
jgi:signal transduction histidine kinase